MVLRRKSLVETNQDLDDGSYEKLNSGGRSYTQEDKRSASRALKSGVRRGVRRETKIDVENGRRNVGTEDRS